MRTFESKLSLTLLVLLLFLAGKVIAAPEVWISPTGDDANSGTESEPFLTLGHAVDQVDTGGIVHVTPGTYSYDVSVTVNKPVTIRGTGENLIRTHELTGLKSGDEPTTKPLIEFLDAASTLIVTSDDVSLINLYLRKLDTSDGVIVDVRRGGSWMNYFLYQNIEIRNCVFEGGRRGAFIAAESLTVADSSFFGQPRDSLFLSSVQGRTRILGNSFEGESGSRKAILFENFSSEDPPTSGDILIAYNTLQGKTNFVVFGQWLADNTPATRLVVRHNTIGSADSKLISFIVGPLQDPDAFERFTDIIVRDNIMAFADIGVFIDYDDFGFGSDPDFTPAPAQDQIQVLNNITYTMWGGGDIADPTGLIGYRNTSATSNDMALSLFLTDANQDINPLFEDPTHADNNFALDDASPGVGAALDFRNIGADQSNAPFVPDTDRDGLDDGAEFNLGSDPNNPDTSGNGLLDGIEWIIGTDPLDPTIPEDTTDTDGDGLPDWYEELIGTDPNNPDTNGNGFVDGIEVLMGSDPLDPDTIPALGDANNDGSVDNADALLMLGIWIGLYGEEVPEEFMDLDRNGPADFIDAIILFNWHVGNVPYLPFPSIYPPSMR